MRVTLVRFVGSRSRIVGLALGLMVIAPGVACHRKGAAAAATQETATVKKSFDQLKARNTALENQFGDLRKKVDTIPSDLPRYQETRETFFATEEGRGVVDAKLTLLSTRLDAAIAAGKPEDLQQLSKEITDTSASVGQIEQLYVTLLHQVMALQRMQEKQHQAEAKEATKQAANNAPAAATTEKKLAGKQKGNKPAKP